MAGLAGTLGLPKLARALPRSPDVVIIGAGSAGIGAARALIAAGKSVVVIEAADRIGGRAYTDTTTFGVPYDQGCSWLQGPRSLPHVALAQDLGFTLTDHANAREAFFVDGQKADYKELNRYHRTFDATQSAVAEAHDVSVASVAPDMPYAGTVQAWMAMGNAVDMADLSTADINAYIDYDVDYLVREGLGTLVFHLGRDLPVKLNTAATSIDWSGPGVRVETTDGTIEAETCIVTVSTGVLGSGAIRFTPDLPVETQEAIADVPMGLLTKIALQFDGERFGLGPNDWLSYALPEDRPETTSLEACYFVTFPSDLDLAVGFVGGQFAWDLADAGADTAIDYALNAFAGAVGNDAKSHFVNGHMSDWHANPLTQGAYAAAKPGRHAAREELKTPLGDKVFFAGEALGVPLAALCSGAHLSGEVTAARVLARLNGDSCGSCDARGATKGRLREVSQ
ncbi:MAG: NAD(P)/FAD-dependent oxidoreductase [Pseudomonadota bacterium]